MIRIQNIPLPIGGGEEQLRKRAARLLGLNPGQLRSLTLARQSIDARKKSDVHYVCTVHVEVDNEARIMARCRDKNVSLHAERPYAFPPVRRTSPLPPVVVGMGPSGLFAALFLARNGVIPIVLERGRPVEERTADVERFWATGVLDTTSNVQFGEGGAGTFSDGKLTTGTHDPRISTVFRALVEAGAPADILYQHKPHIGTDILRDVVRNVRRELLALGCDVRFGHRLAGLDVRDGALRAVAVDGPGGRYDLPCDALVLSPGHSARDTFQMLLDAGVPMAPKPFAIGVRIEHAQAALSEAQFGPAWERLPAADYKLACHLPTGRSAFTFCVWPGGPPRPWGASPPPTAPASPRRSWTAACPAAWPTPCGVPSPSSTASSAALPRRRPCSPAWRAAPPLRCASSGARTFSPPSGAFTPAARGLGTRAGLPARPWTAFGSPRPSLPNKHIFYIKTPFWRIITPEWGLLWSFTISYDTVKVQFCRKVRDFEAMARKKVETNISFDEMRQKYYVCMDYGLDETGKRVKKYKTYPTLAQARRGLRDFQTEQDTHQTVAPRSMTLDQWLEYWMEEVIQPNRAATTIYGYRKIIDNHLSDALGSVPIQKLTPQHLQQYYSMLMRDKGLSANTVRRHHDLLSCALHMALRQDIILRCPTERVEPPRVIPHEARFYTPAELKRLFGLVEGHWLELIVKLAGSLGLRREEICGLRWSSVDFELRKLHIKEARTAAGAEIVQKETKNRSSNRILHMSDDLYRLLRRERARQAERKLALGDAWPDTGMVAVDAKGNPYSPNAVSLAFTRFIQAHHLPKITLHGLRHTFATVASAQGAPLFDIGKALGHSTPATTGKIYTHLLDQNHTATLDRVANALK